MRSIHAPATRAILAGVLLPVCAAAQSVPWAVSLDGALAEARAKGTILVIAIQMPGERGSDEMLSRHYADPRIAELAQHTVNLLLEVAPGHVPDDEREVRERWLEVAPDAPVAVPHHLFVKPGADGEPGELLSSFAYAVTVGQLEWSWADALRKVRPDFEWEPAERTRAPETLLYGAAETEGLPPPPNEQQVDDAIKTLRSGTRDPKQVFESYRILLSSGEREALQYGRSEMRSLSAFLKRPAMRLCADVSPRAWHLLAEEYVADSDPRVRAEAARALEQLAAPESIRPLRKAFADEEDEDAKGRMIRALATCGPADKAVIRELRKVLEREKSAPVRVQAAMAIGTLEDRDAVASLLETALADEDAKVRSAAAFVIAARRDPTLAQLLESATEAETDLEVSGWLAIAAEVVAGGDLRKFEPFVTKVAGDRKRGDGARQFSIKVDEWIERMRGRRGGGERGEGEGAGRGR